MFLIVPLPPHGMKDLTDQIPLHRLHHNIDSKKIKQHPCGKFTEIRVLFQQQKQHGNDQKPGHVGLADIGKLISAPLYPLWRVQLEKRIQNQIQRNNENQNAKINLRRQNPRTRVKPQIPQVQTQPCQGVGQNDHHPVQHHMEAV
jgi:hypothetical protein